MSSTCGATADARFDDRSVQGRTAVKTHCDQLDCQASATAQLRARNAQLDQEWENNVRKYGEAEACRHQHKEWQILKDLQRLDTSDAEEMAQQDKEANSLITVTVQYCVDKKVCWETNIAEKPLDEFNIVDLEQ